FFLLQIVDRQLAGKLFTFGGCGPDGPALLGLCTFCLGSLPKNLDVALSAIAGCNRLGVSQLPAAPFAPHLTVCRVQCRSILGTGTLLGTSASSRSSASRALPSIKQAPQKAPNAAMAYNHHSSGVSMAPQISQMLSRPDAKNAHLRIRMDARRA